MKQITVIGSAQSISSDVYQMAEELGKAIASRGAVLITGGRGGVMEAVCKGAKEKQGLTVGILPGCDKDANPYVDIIIVTGMGDGRNIINIKSADAIIAVNGGAGTLSEIALALKTGRKVIAIRPSGGVAEKMAGIVIDGREVTSVESVEEAIDLVFEEN
ncbi:TIGR00725 family protein [Thermoproteota archaeon]